MVEREGPVRVRMILPSGQVTEITANEATALVRGAFMRPGNVKVEQSHGSCSITDQHGTTLLTVISEVAPANAR